MRARSGPSKLHMLKAFEFIVKKHAFEECEELSVFKVTAKA